MHKGKKLFILSLISLPTLFVSFSNATYYGGGKNVTMGTLVQMSDICNDSDNAGVSTYITFDKNLNIKYIENGIEYNGARMYACGRAGTRTYLYWNNNKLTEGFGARDWSSSYANAVNNMGYINNICVTSKGSTCYTGNSITMQEFTNLKTTRESFTIMPYNELNGNITPCNSGSSCNGGLNQPIARCFNSATATYCVVTRSQGNPLGTTPYNPIPIGEANINASINTWSSYFSTSPIYGGYGGTGTPTQTTPNTSYICPTIAQLISTYGTEYNTGLCYSNSLIYSGGTIQTVTPKSIFELYPTLASFNTDINTYNSYCTAPNSTQACQTMFENKTIEYTLIAKIPQNVKPIDLYQYCNLQLNYPDKNATTCVTSGSTIITGQITTGTNIINNETILQEIINGDATIISPQTGTVYDGITNAEEYKGIIESLQSVYSKLTTLFEWRTGVTGIIPDYIMRIILAIVLFKIFKK